MSRPSFDDIRKLYWKLIIPFHQIERDMPLPIRNHQNDNDAEHSWSLSFMAVALASEVDSSLDVGMVALYATVHDIVEVYAGDTSIWAQEEYLNSKQEREQAAVKTIKSELPAFPSLAAFIEKYESKDSKEARFVFALDKFLNLLNLYEDKGYYYHKHKITADQLKERLVNHKEKAQSHPEVARYYNQLHEAFFSHPEFFYEPKKNGGENL